MKKQTILNLIKYHAEKNEPAFRNEAYEVAKDFDKAGEYKLAEYIMSLISDASTFVSQSYSDDELHYLEKINTSNTSSLPLPQELLEDIMGIINAINSRTGVSRFLFEGAPGTGKTETVKHLARVLEFNLYMVSFETVLDCKLGQSAKNISELFEEIRKVTASGKALILLDEIDALVFDRVNSNDVREMGRVTSSFLKELDKLSQNSFIIATTNLYKMFDKALARRFDARISFDRYSQDNLSDIGLSIVNTFLSTSKHSSKNITLLRKVFADAKLPLPGDLKNIIKTSIAFSDPNNPFDYIRRIHLALNDNKIFTVPELKEKGFSVRDIEILICIPKSSAARQITETEGDKK